jgi:hypothetical protein
MSAPNRLAVTLIHATVVDVNYLAHLSDDAVPQLVQGLRLLPSADRRTLARALVQRDTAGDWRAWNLSRERAGAVLRVHRAELRRLAGG